MPECDLFLSYARKDNLPLDAKGDGDGWITAFHRRLTAQHLIYAQRRLKVFFDKKDIRSDEDWRRRIYQHLRTSSLFLAFLSPNYLASPICRLEWEEYLRLEHTLARGDDGIKQIYCIQVPDLHGDEVSLQRFEADKRDWIADIRRRNLHHSFDLTPWFDAGAEQLRALDAKDRIDALRRAPRHAEDRKLVDLADRIAEIDRAIALRLDQATLAGLAPGRLDASYTHFVGRSREMQALHSALTATHRIGVVGALHGFGGQGKTALAIQYAYAYAGHYAAGGRWRLPAEGRRYLADVLTPLPGLLGFPQPERRGLSDEEARAFAVHDILTAAKAQTFANVAVIAEKLAKSGNVHSPEGVQPRIEPHLLLILDNVDTTDLLSAQERALIAGEDWLQIVITTRLDPSDFGRRSEIAAIAVDDLPPEDALALLREFRDFKTEGDESAARAIVKTLGGFTLAVELVGAYLAAHEDSTTYPAYRARLEAEGEAQTDQLAQDEKVRAQIRHREMQIGLVLADTLEHLSPAARETLAFAAFFPPDLIVTHWLRALVQRVHPELAPEAARPGYPDTWREVLHTLAGRRLLPANPTGLPAAPEVEVVRIHRMIAAHLLGGMPPAEHAARRGEVMQLSETIGTYAQDWRRDRSRFWMLAPLAALAEHLAAGGDDRLVAIALNMVGGAELDCGLFLRAQALLDHAGAMLERLFDDRPNDAQAARDLSLSLDKLGDFYQRRRQAGDQARALDAYEKSLAIDQHLLDDSPDDAEATRDLSISLNKLGDFYQRRGQAGDQARALNAYEKSLASRQRLLDASPDDAQAARDLSVLLTNLGDFYQRRGQAGDQARTRDAYEKSLAINQRLLDDSPDDAQAARDLSVSLTNLGDFYQRRGQAKDKARALDAYEKSLAIDQRLLDDSPDDAQAARDLSISLTHLGDFYQRRGQAGDRARALDAYEKSLAIHQRLFDDNPDDAQVARDRSVSLERLGDFYQRRGRAGDQARVLDAYEKSLAIRQRLFDDNPDDAQAARDLSLSLIRMANCLESLGRADEAAKARVACFEILDRFHKEGRPMDEDMRAQHAQLATLVRNGGRATARKSWLSRLFRFGRR